MDVRALLVYGCGRTTVIAIVYLLIFPGILVVATVLWWRAAMRYGALLDRTGLYPRPESVDPFSIGFLGTYRLLARARGAADRAVRAGDFGPEAAQLLETERRRFTLLAVAMTVSMLGVVLLTPVIRAAHDATGSDTDTIALVILLWIGWIGLALMLAWRIARLVRSGGPLILVIGYVASLAVAAATALIFSARIFGAQ